MLSNVVVVLVAITVAALLFSRKMQSSITWQATVTPLASIIGSGFLVSVPLLAGEVGNWSVFAMAALIGAAYLVGAAIRFNIRHVEPLLAASAQEKAPRLEESLERLSHLVLACVALSVAHGSRELPNRRRNMALFAAVALFCLAVLLFGIPSAS